MPSPHRISKRNASLDLLRGIAVLLVLVAHAPWPPVLTDGLPGHLVQRATGIGSYGVDLFFCLSGFLISGLLFHDLQKRGTI